MVTFGFLGGADPFLERRLPKGNACRRLKPKAPSGHAIDPFTRRALDIIETEEALEIFADMAGVPKDSVEVSSNSVY